nr:hypothetical protein [Tanacetum cinerariifolium]
MAKINKNLMRVLQVNQQVKAVTPNCETCGGPHSFTDCPATVGQIQNVYAVGAYQGNSYQPQGNRNLLSYRLDNYLGPPGFTQNQNRNNQNQNFQNQNRNQGNFHPQRNNQGRNQLFQGASQGQNPPPAYQAPTYQAPGYQALLHQPHIPQPQVVTTNEFTNFMKANVAILKNMQTNMTSLTNSNLELKNMFGQFMKMNTASSSGSGTLPGNTITNPKEELKGITTRSGKAYQGPTIPNTSSSLPPIVERKTEATKGTVHPTNNGSTKDVQPLVVQTESPILNSEPVVAPIIEPIVAPIIELIVAPVSGSKPNQRPSIPYPSRLHDQKLCDKANVQREKFFQIFKDLNFNISFADALILMPKFGPSIKSLLTNKDKLFELARTLLNEHCSAVLLKKLPEKLRDPDKFLIPCDFPGMVECLALISFLKTERALIDVFKGELALCVGKEAITFNLDQTSRYSANYNDMTANRIDVIDMACEDIPKKFSVSLINSDFLLEEVDAFLDLKDDPTSPKFDQSYIDTEGDILLLEAFLIDDPSLPPPNQGNYLPQVQKELKICKAKTDKSSIDEPPEGIDPEFYTHKILIEDDFEPAVQHQRRVNPKFYDVIKNEVLKLLDAGLIYPISDSSWVLLLQEFTFKVIDTKGAENLAADHLSRLENHQNVLDPKEIMDPFLSRHSIWFLLVKNKFFKDVKHYFWDDPFLFKIYADQVIRRGIDFMGPFPSSRGNKYILVAVDYLSKWVEAKALPTNDARVVCKFLKNLFARFGTPEPSSVIKEHTSVMTSLQRIVQLNELNELHDQAYENFLIYKEKTKRLHDSKIKDRVFNIGARVLLFNSRLKILSSKLKSRWSGPFTIFHVFFIWHCRVIPNRRAKFKVNGHRLRHYFGEDIPKMVVPDFKHSSKTNEFKDWVKLSDPKQALHGRHPMLILVSSNE